MGMEIANSEYAFAARIDNIKEASKGNGILSGCAVTANATPDMFVDIAAGSVRISNAYVTVSLVANQAITAADGTNDRWDILEVGVNGTVDYTAGTAAANPMPPDLAEDHVLLATIFVENNSSAVETADIQDNRIIYEESGVQTPIGSVVAWLSNITGVPSLPTGWALCDGSTISDAGSPLNGQTIPDLNADARFLRGADTAGGTGGQETIDLAHTHTISIPIKSSGIGTAAKGHPGVTGSTLADATDIKPKYINVVWIIRIK